MAGPPRGTTFLLGIYPKPIRRVTLLGMTVGDDALHLWVQHPHGSLDIPAASFCSKAPILELLQAQRNVCVFRMSG